jgi:hypothetical protein
MGVIRIPFLLLFIYVYRRSMRSALNEFKTKLNDRRPAQRHFTCSAVGDTLLTTRDSRNSRLRTSRVAVADCSDLWLTSDERSYSEIQAWGVCVELLMRFLNVRRRRDTAFYGRESGCFHRGFDASVCMYVIGKLAIKVNKFARS